MCSNTNNKVAPLQAIHYVDAGSPHLVYRLILHFIHFDFIFIFCRFSLFFLKISQKPVKIVHRRSEDGEEETNCHSTVFDHTSESSKHLLQVGGHWAHWAPLQSKHWTSEELLRIIKTFHFPLNSHFCPQLNQWKDKVKGSIWEGWEDRRHRLTFPTFLTTFLSGIFSFQHER